MGAVRLAQLEDLKAGVEDWAYRLHYNQGQNRADLFARVRAGPAGVEPARYCLCGNNARTLLLSLWQAGLRTSAGVPRYPNRHHTAALQPVQVGCATGVATAAALLPISVAPLVAGGAVGAAVALAAHVGTKPAQG